MDSKTLVLKLLDREIIKIKMQILEMDSYESKELEPLRREELRELEIARIAVINNFLKNSF